MPISRKKKPAVPPIPLGMLVRKGVLDRRIAAVLGKKTEDVSLVTEQFLTEVLLALAATHCVRLDGLGTLRVSKRLGVDRRYSAGEDRLWKYFVLFKKSDRLKKALHGEKEIKHGKVRRRRARKRAGEASKPGVPALRKTP